MFWKRVAIFPLYLEKDLGPSLKMMLYLWLLPLLITGRSQAMPQMLPDRASHKCAPKLISYRCEAKSATDSYLNMHFILATALEFVFWCPVKWLFLLPFYK